MFFFCYLSIPICVAQIQVEPAQNCGQAKVTLLKKADCSCPSSYQMPVAPQLGVRLPSPCCDFLCPERQWELWMMLQWLWVHSSFCLESSGASSSSTTSSSWNLLHPLLQRSLSLCSVTLMSPFGAEHSTIFYSFHVSLLWVSVITGFYCKQMLLRWG